MGSGHSGQLLNKDTLESPQITDLIYAQVYPRPATINVNLPPDKTKIGLFVKREILYLFDYAEAMNKLYWNFHDFRTQYPEPSEESRNYFNTELIGRMKIETDFLGDIFYTIVAGCIFIIRAHEAANAPKEYLNLQRRKLYLLTLCLAAIIDSRVCTREGPDEFFLKGDENDLRTRHREILDPEQKWVSGINMESVRETITRPVRIRMDHYIEQDKNPHFQLPTHFVELLQLMYKKNDFKINTFNMRRLLASYAIFLAQVIWYPEDYGVYMQKYHDYGVILGTNLAKKYVENDGCAPDPHLTYFTVKKWKSKWDQFGFPKQRGQPPPPDPELANVGPYQEDANDWTTEQNYIKVLRDERLLMTMSSAQNPGSWWRIMFKK